MEHVISFLISTPLVFRSQVLLLHTSESPESSETLRGAFRIRPWRISGLSLRVGIRWPLPWADYLFGIMNTSKGRTRAIFQFNLLYSL